MAPCTMTQTQGGSGRVAGLWSAEVVSPTRTTAPSTDLPKKQLLQTTASSHAVFDPQAFLFSICSAGHF